MVARADAKVLERLCADETNFLLLFALGLALDRRARLGRRQVKDGLAELVGGGSGLVRRKGSAGRGLSLLLLALGGGGARPDLGQLAGELGTARRHGCGGRSEGDAIGGGRE
jgi:hypothetical protein